MIEIVKPAYAASVDLGSHYIFGKVGSLGSFLTSLGGPAFGIAGLLLVFYILIGAFRFLTSAGSKEGVAGAREMIVHAIIGFFLLMLLFLVFEFITQYFCLGTSVIGPFNLNLFNSKCQ